MKFKTYPKAHGSSVLVELEANETVDEQAPVQSADSARVNSREPGVYNVRGRNDGRVKECAEELDKHVNVEEENDLLAADGRVLGSDVEEHDQSHRQSRNVHYTCGCEISTGRDEHFTTHQAGRRSGFRAGHFERSR